MGFNSLQENLMVSIEFLHHDEHLPQLLDLTSKRTMKRVFQGALEKSLNGRYYVSHVKILRFNYFPGETCRICYQLKIKNQNKHTVSRPLLYGRVAEIIPTKNLQISDSAPDNPKGFWIRGSGRLVIPEMNLLLWRFPADPMMPHLERLYDSRFMKNIFSAHAERLSLSEKSPIKKVQTDLIKYVPESRCAQVHKIKQECGRKAKVYSKTYTDKTRAFEVYHILQELWKVSESDPEFFMIPEPLFHLPECSSIFLRFVKGKNANKQIRALNHKQMIQKIASGLARLHQTQINDLPPSYPLKNEIKFETILNLLDLQIPEMKSMVGEIIHGLIHHRPQCDVRRVTTIHGAFRYSQLMLVNHRLALIDFDKIGAGDPILDVAGFVSHLLYLVCQQKISPKKGEAAVRFFCTSYENHMQFKIEDRLLAWYVAELLIIKHMYKRIKHAKKQYYESVRILIHLAKDIMQNGLMNNTFIWKKLANLEA